MSRKNKSAEFIDDCIADALLQLMEEKPMEKITAQEITDLAGVGRATFFRHFRSKDEILTYKLIRLWNQWVIDHNLSREGHFSLSNTEDLLAFNLSIRPLICRIYAAGMQHAIYMAFYQVMEPYFKFEPFHNYTSKFYAYGGIRASGRMDQARFCGDAETNCRHCGAPDRRRGPARHLTADL